MSNTNDQGSQNAAQAEAEALRALEAGAWRVWQAGSGPLPAAYARWCATEIGLATAALRRDCEANAKRAEAAEAALAKMTGERDNYYADYRREYMLARKAEIELAQLRGLPEEKRPEPYVPRVGDVVSYCGGKKDDNPRVVTGIDGDRTCVWYVGSRESARLQTNLMAFMRPATPAERAAAGLAPEAHAQPQQPQVLKEHLAWIEADAELTAITFHDKYDFEASLAAKDRAVAASIALRAAVARRDGAKGGS